jgi:protein-L-isoaspartate(D-aspartate) O-methyltransferase
MVSRQIESALGGRQPVRDAEVLRAMRGVPRHEFVRPGDAGRAYADRPLPIGHGQTISQPYIVAVMTALLDIRPGDVVLEIGTGSGYQAAVLAEIADTAYTIEIIEPLGESARRRLAELGYANIHAAIGDGYFGWPDHPPFDGILVTAAASHIPPPLIEQLSPGARMVIPVGGPFQVQSLMLVEKQADGNVIQWNMGAVRFVPLTRGE